MPRKKSLDKLIHQGLLSYPDAVVTLQEFENKYRFPARKPSKAFFDIIMRKPTKKIMYIPDSETEWVGVGLKAESHELYAGVSWDRTMKQVTRWASIGVYFSSIGKAGSVRKTLQSLGEERDEPEEDSEVEKYAVWLSENIKVTSLEWNKKSHSAKS